MDILGATFGSAAHFLWCMRNKELFQFATPTVDEMFQRFGVYFHWIQIPSSLCTRLSNRPSRQLPFIKWNPPPDAWLKINSDGGF